MNEFSIIKNYLTQAYYYHPEVHLGVGDDCAMLKVPENKLLALSTDTLVEATHFFSDMPAYALGYKALAVNLSDLAAMGAQPLSALLSLTLPSVDSLWLEQFARGFFDLAGEFQVDLIGGNVARGPLSVTVQVQGLVDQGQMLRRDSAQAGDLIFVSGPLGAAAAALKAKQEKVVLENAQEKVLMNAWNKPAPRVQLGRVLPQYAHAAIDVSDGLLADLNHILQASQKGATVQVDQVPVADSVLELFDEATAQQLALNGGEDYELCFTAPPQYQEQLINRYGCIKIGKVESEPELRCEKPDGSLLNMTEIGFQHFKG